MGEIKERTDEPGKFRQFVAAMVVNLSALTYGTMIGWQSPMAPQLQRGTLTTPLMGTLAEKLGRKMTGCLVAIPFLICCLLTIFASDHTHLFIARFFAGVGGAGSIFLVPLYVSEISCDAIRGMLGSLLVFVLNIGILMAYIFGAILSFNVYSICAIIPPILYFATFLFLPETPVYLVRRNRLREAARSLTWLRAGHKLTVERELLRLQVAAKEAATSTRSVGLWDLFRDRGTIKGVLISLGLFGGQQLCGIFAMISYTETIFRISGSSMSPNTAAITVGGIQVVGSYLSTSLMERTGRRPLLLVSCAGMCACHYVLGTFCYFQELGYDVSTFGWIPVVALSIFVITYCLGMYGCFFLLGTSCIASFLFVFILIPETKGRSREDILNELNGIPWPSKMADKEKISPTDV
ncbi:hypothetical protein KPH14_011942 [Odynerus spinipes]|uniref:Major facilitator superfamily (MFS) profile domain-containing protein n=1 Tax=Odynerus spinipes TaxID=1348599 RepID=A0AAD9VJK1_9HYME|nr:hypothetical protein KPH14_011942 [Odynerus spinipes]